MVYGMHEEDERESGGFGTKGGGLWNGCKILLNDLCA